MRANKIDARDKRNLRRAPFADQTALFPPNMLEQAVKLARKSGKDSLIFANLEK